jgi:hypothetical protein
MISSTSSSDPLKRPDFPAGPTGASARPFASRPDRLSTNAAAHLHTALAETPEVRAAVVMRARALMADPNYPSMQVIQSIAAKIVAAPDLSVDES